MRLRPPALVTAVIVVLAAGLLGACSSDESTAECGEDSDCDPTDPASEARNAAIGVCSILVEFDNTVADEVNAASRQITPVTDPDVARALLVDATDAIQAAADALPEQYRATRPTDDGDIGRLYDDASAATAGLDEQLEAIRAELTDGLAGEGSREILSAVFIDMEKVQSLAQPDQADYDDAALVEALATEPSCMHTISR